MSEGETICFVGDDAAAGIDHEARLEASGGEPVRGRPPIALVLLGVAMLAGGFAEAVYTALAGSGSPGELANPVLIDTLVGEAGLLIVTTGVWMDTRLVRVVNLLTSVEVPISRVTSFESRHGFQVWTDSSTRPISASAYGSSVLGEIVSYPRARHLVERCTAVLTAQRTGGHRGSTPDSQPVQRRPRIKAFLVGSLTLYVVNAVPVVVSIVLG